MATVLPGQPLEASALFKAGQGSYSRGGKIYAAIVGKMVRTGGIISVQGSEDRRLVIPEPNSIIIGSVSRITRMAATVSILTVDGGECASEGFVGIIRIADIRQTEPDKVKVSSCFRPGDIVRCKVISLGDSRSYFLSTASNSLGVLFAVSAEGEALEALSWEEMVDPSTGIKESRKVAGPEI